MFAFVADLRGVSQKEETRLFEITLKKSGFAGWRGRSSNQLADDLSEIQAFVTLSDFFITAVVQSTPQIRRF
jgi:hypothetical protein